VGFDAKRALGRNQELALAKGWWTKGEIKTRRSDITAPTQGMECWTQKRQDRRRKPKETTEKQRPPSHNQFVQKYTGDEYVVRTSQVRRTQVGAANTLIAFPHAVENCEIHRKRSIHARTFVLTRFQHLCRGCSSRHPMFRVTVQRSLCISGNYNHPAALERWHTHHLTHSRSSPLCPPQEFPP
jgi:hypothetical protein